jgi:hypothetical protein
MSIKASKETLRRAQAEKDSWHTPEHRPEYSTNTNEFSVDVLLYNPDYDLHAIGWFNFDDDTWSALHDSVFNIKEPFLWSYLPKPKLT